MGSLLSKMTDFLVGLHLTKPYFGNLLILFHSQIKIFVADTTMYVLILKRQIFIGVAQRTVEIFSCIFNCSHFYSPYLIVYTTSINN